jgi:hypothetical protein
MLAWDDWEFAQCKWLYLVFDIELSYEMIWDCIKFTKYENKEILMEKVYT